MYLVPTGTSDLRPANDVQDLLASSVQEQAEEVLRDRPQVLGMTMSRLTSQSDKHTGRTNCR